MRAALLALAAELTAPAGGAQHRPDCLEEPGGARRVVILGSSTTAGVGASRSGQSWAGRLSEALRRRGVEVINRSISGSNTAASLERFYRDAARLGPSVVILATSPTNERIAQVGEVAVQTYIENTRALIGRVRAAGAMPIVAAPSATAGSSDRIGRLVHDLQNRLERLGVPMIDFLGPVEDAAARYLPGIAADEVHMNDAGHEALFDATPLWLFDPPEWTGAPILPSSGYWRPADRRPDCTPLGAGLHRPAASWTVVLRYRPAAGGGGWILRAGPVALENGNGWLRLSVHGETVAEKQGLAAEGWRLTALSCQRLSGRLRVIVDGSIQLEHRTELEPVSEFQLDIVEAGASFEFASLSVHRSPLPVESFEDRGDGSLPARSLEALVLHWTPPLLAQGWMGWGHWLARSCAEAWVAEGRD